MRDAWIGDAVLLLFAREEVMGRCGRPDVAMMEDLVSNRFLSTVGQPDHVEAEIGRIYATSGLDAAFGHIRDRLMPVFERQEANRRRGRQGR